MLIACWHRAMLRQGRKPASDQWSRQLTLPADALQCNPCRDPENLLIGPWEPESQFEGGLAGSEEGSMALGAACGMMLPLRAHPVRCIFVYSARLRPLSCRHCLRARERHVPAAD